MASITKKQLKSGIRWMAIIRTAQIPYLSKTFKTKDAARLWAKRVETDADLARAEACPVLRKTTLAELADDYLLNHWRGKDPSRSALVGWWVDQLGGTRLKDLDRAKVQSVLQRFKSGKAKRGDGVGTDG